MTAREAKGGGRALLRLLKALSRTGAVAEVDTSNSASPVRIRVLSSLAGQDQILHHASADAWQRAVAMRLITERSDAHWEIAALGRERLAISKSPTTTSNRTGQSREPPGLTSSAGPTIARPRTVGPIEAASESPLAWLRRRRDKSGAPMISAAQFEAGERLRSDFERGQLMPRLTVDWDQAAAGGSRRVPSAAVALELSDGALAARQRVNHALTALGPELASVLVDVCCHLKGLEQLERAAGWPQRSAKIVLTLGLSALARHYGIERTNPNAGPEQIRHWGADGYRPDLDRADQDPEFEA